MLISIIVAMDRHGLVGTSEGLPWKLSADLKRFRALTMGKPMIMGRTTHEMIGKALDGRANIVLTRNSSWQSGGCIIASTFDDALEKAKSHLNDAQEVMVIGGAQLYQEALSVFHRLYLTVIEGEFHGNVYFPVEALLSQRWKVLQHESYPEDERNAHPHEFLIAERNPKGETLPVRLSPESN